jgi:hypothetical protein
MSGAQLTGLIVGIIVIALTVWLIFWMRGKETLPHREEPLPARATTLTGGMDDDLTRIEGIGPKIQSTLRMAGIHCYNDLVLADPAWLREVLLKANLRLADPTTWPKQAQMLAEGKLAEFEKFTSELRGGRQI